MPTLFAIGADMEALETLLYEVGGDVSEDDATDAVESWFAELAEDRDRKLDGYGRYITELTARATAKRDEASRLLQRARTEEERARWLKDRLLRYLQDRGLKALDTPLHRFAVAGNGGRLPLVVDVEPEDLPEPYRVEKRTFLRDETEIRAALDRGDLLQFARYGERGCHLMIR